MHTSAGITKFSMRRECSGRDAAVNKAIIAICLERSGSRTQAAVARLAWPRQPEYPNGGPIVGCGGGVAHEFHILEC